MTTRDTTARSIRSNPVSFAGELVLAAVVSVVPLVWRITAGAGWLPAGDAWAYERIARTLHETGHLVMVNWNDITLVGMLVVTEAWTSLMGFSQTQLHVLGSVAGFVALLALRDLLRTAGVESRWFPILVFGTFVGFVGVSGTYLSDLFSAAGALWGLALAMRLIEPSIVRPRSRMVVLAIGAGLAISYGFSVRQHAGAAIIAACLVLWRRRDRLGHLWIVAGATFVTIVAPLHLWRMSVEHGGQTVLEFHPRGATTSLIAMWFTLGLIALPFAIRLPAASPPLRRVSWLAALPPIGVLAGSVIGAAAPLARGNSQVGEFVISGGAIGWALAAIGIGAGTWTWIRVVNMKRIPGWPYEELILLFVVTAGLEAASSMMIGLYFPRYSLVSAAVLVCALSAQLDASSHPVTTRRRHLSIAALTLLALASLWTLDRSISGARALEEAADVAACAGIAPPQLDGGFSWNGLHYEGIASTTGDHRFIDDGLPDTEERLAFPEMERVAVVVGDDPGTAYVDSSVGPFSSSGILPINRAELWIVATPPYLEGLRRCAGT